MRGSLPTFILLGKLADAIPVFADMLVIAHGEYEGMCFMVALCGASKSGDTRMLN